MTEAPTTVRERGAAYPLVSARSMSKYTKPRKLSCGRQKMKKRGPDERLSRPRMNQQFQSHLEDRGQSCHREPADQGRSDGRGRGGARIGIGSSGGQRL